MNNNNSNFGKSPNYYPVSLENNNFTYIEKFENDFKFDKFRIYNIGDIVIFNHMAYKMNNNIGVAGIEPSNTVYWQKLIWNKDTKYHLNDIFTMVNYSGNKTYKVTSDIMGVEFWNLIDYGPQSYYVWSENIPAADPVKSTWPFVPDRAEYKMFEDFTNTSQIIGIDSNYTNYQNIQ